MLQLTFTAEPDAPSLVRAVSAYQQLWAAEGERILDRIETLTGLRFAERRMSARVLEGPSRSHPLVLRASYDDDTKLATLVHELLHRVLSTGGTDRPASREGQESLREHELVDLFLFDAWTDLYGEDFARRHVERESQLRPMYGEAWKRTLLMDRSARSARGQTLVQSRRPPH